MSRKVVFAPNEFYHLYNRGTEKRKIFSSKSDYERFLALLYLANGENNFHISNERSSTLIQLLALDRGESLVDIGAYCLMPNHFHILVREHTEGGVSRFMQKLITGYTMYFNTRYERTGALFQGKYKAEHASDDRYLKYLISYIHLNPIKLIDPHWRENGIKNRQKACDFLDSYRYSSFLDYSGQQRPERCTIYPSSIPNYFETPNKFAESITDWLAYQTNKPVIEVRPRYFTSGS